MDTTRDIDALVQKIAQENDFPQTPTWYQLRAAIDGASPGLFSLQELEMRRYGILETFARVRERRHHQTVREVSGVPALSSDLGTGSIGRESSNYARNRPGPGDAVLFSFMDGGERPEIGRFAGADLLPPDGGEEKGDGAFVRRDSITSIDLPGNFSADYIEDMENALREKEREGSAAPSVAAAKQPKLEYELKVIQQPVSARACGLGAKSSVDRRPIDPPPVVELKIFELNGSNKTDVTFSHNANFFLFATLEIEGPKTPATRAPVLTGMPVSTMAYLDRPREAGYFIFPDLSVRYEGKYRLSFNLYEEDKNAKSTDEKFTMDWLMELKSDVFESFSARVFPVLEESTVLTRALGEQGCRVYVRRDVRLGEVRRNASHEETNPRQTGTISQWAEEVMEIPNLHHSSSLSAPATKLRNISTGPAGELIEQVILPIPGTHRRKFVMQEEQIIPVENEIGQFGSKGPSPALLSDESSEGSADIESVSWLSDGQSSQTSFSETLGAPNEFADLLLHHESLKPLFGKAYEEISGKSFKKEFNALLKAFSVDLSSEARRPSETVAAQLVRHSRRKVTFKVWNEVYGFTETESLAGALDQTRLSVAKKLEEALRRMNSHEGQPHVASIAQASKQQADDSSDDEDGYGKLVNLQQVKKFLVDSQAFNTFQQRFKLLVASKELQEASLAETGELSAPSAIAPEDNKDNFLAEAVITEHHEAPVEEAGTASAALVSESGQGGVARFRGILIRCIRYLSNVTFEGASTILVTTKFGGQMKSLLRQWQTMHNMIDRHFRPVVPQGYRRLEWTCGCGTTLYADFDDSDSRQVDELQSELLEETNQISPEQEGFTQHNPGGASSTHRNAPSYTSLSSSGAPLQNLPASNTYSTSNTRAGTALYTPLPIFSDSPLIPQNQKYFAICVNTGEYLTIVGEIDVSSITWDGDFFREMWKKYYALRGFRSWHFRPFFVKPVDVKYVRFAVDYGTDPPRAVIQANPPDFPDEREVQAGRYEYTPCPLKTRPTAEIFLHHRVRPDCASRMWWFRRVPKKLSPGVLQAYIDTRPNEDVIGWGVHIIEGLNKKAVTWMCFLLLCLSFTVAILYTRLTHDASSGFTIAAFLVSAGALLLPALYFQWKED